MMVRSNLGSRWLEMGGWTAFVTIIAMAPACSRGTVRLAPEPIDLPAPGGSVVPQMTKTAAGDVVLSWLEPRPDRGYRFRAALRREGRWEEPATIDDHPDITMFSADLPGVVDLPSGEMLAYWERVDGKAPGNPYATTIHLARSIDGGRTGSLGRHRIATIRPARTASFLRSALGGIRISLAGRPEPELHAHAGHPRGCAERRMAGRDWTPVRFLGPEC
jgi:hypothetical protein